MNADRPLPEASGVIPQERSAPPIGLIPPPSRWKPSKAWPRGIPIVLGAWLFASSFLWPHVGDERTNTWLVGTLLFWFGALSLYVPWVRWATALLGAWLSASTLAIDHVVRPTMWHDVLVGLVVLAAALVPPARSQQAPRA